jgi:hypothetical protein
MPAVTSVGAAAQAFDNYKGLEPCSQTANTASVAGAKGKHDLSKQR